MTPWQGLVLGLVQGLTEFLPVSSSGHLVLAQALVGLDRPALPFDALVHGATMIAIVATFRRRLVELLRGRSPAYLAKLALGTVPAAAVGLGFRRAVESTFGSPAFVTAALTVTGTALLSLYLAPEERWRKPPGRADATGRHQEPAGPSWAAAWWIGCAQAVAILPGISRSGSTIVAGIWLGVAPAAAAEFSFLLGIPAIAGAVVLEAQDMGTASGAGQGLAYVLGAVLAFLSGLVAIRLVFRLLARREFRWLGFYCWAVALAAALWLWAR